MPNNAAPTSAGTPRRLRFPLSAKIVLWFFVNVLFLALAALIFARVQFRFGLDSLLTGQANDRLQAMAQVVVAELNDRPPPEWGIVLDRTAEAYQVQLGLFRNDGAPLAGNVPPLPPEVRARLNEPREPRGPRGPRPPLPPNFAQNRRPEEHEREEFPRRLAPLRGQAPPPAFPKSIVHAGTPRWYWVIIRVPLLEMDRGQRMPATLIVASETLRGGGLLFDYTPWILGGAAVLALSVLLWVPLVRGITRALREMTGAAESIAQGRFETQLSTARSDELGRLASALNDMATRLREFFTGQKRFLGDIAHELCSPLARMEMALAILDQRADEKQRTYLGDVREELHQMSALVNELLSFSKAGVRGPDVQLQRVPLAELARRVVAREAAETAEIQVEIDDALTVLAAPDLLERALGNVVRNAIRYAANAGPIRVTANPRSEHILLSVSDSGPGVPEVALHRLFDPFFRPETARTRETGGAGLGLAIVKSCIEACGGTVHVQNRRPSGLQVDMELQRSS